MFFILFCSGKQDHRSKAKRERHFILPSGGGGLVGRGSASLHIWPESAPGQEMRQWAVGGGGAGAGAGLQ